MSHKLWPNNIFFSKQPVNIKIIKVMNKAYDDVCVAVFNVYNILYYILNILP